MVMKRTADNISSHFQARGTAAQAFEEKTLTLPPRWCSLAMKKAARIRGDDSCEYIWLEMKASCGLREKEKIFSNISTGRHLRSIWKIQKENRPNLEQDFFTIYNPGIFLNIKLDK